MKSRCAWTEFAAFNVSVKEAALAATIKACVKMNDFIVPIIFTRPELASSTLLTGRL